MRLSKCWSSKHSQSKDVPLVVQGEECVWKMRSGTPSSPILFTWVDIEINHAIKSPLASPIYFAYGIKNQMMVRTGDWVSTIRDIPLLLLCTYVLVLNSPIPTFLLSCSSASSPSLFYPPYYRTMDLRRQASLVQT